QAHGCHSLGSFIGLRSRGPTGYRVSLHSSRLADHPPRGTSMRAPNRENSAGSPSAPRILMDVYETAPNAAQAQSTGTAGPSPPDQTTDAASPDDLQLRIALL